MSQVVHSKLALEAVDGLRVRTSQDSLAGQTLLPRLLDGAFLTSITNKDVELVTLLQECCNSGPDRLERILVHLNEIQFPLAVAASEDVGLRSGRFLHIPSRKVDIGACGVQGADGFDADARSPTRHEHNFPAQSVDQIVVSDDLQGGGPLVSRAIRLLVEVSVGGERVRHVCGLVCG